MHEHLNNWDTYVSCYTLKICLYTIQATKEVRNFWSLAGKWITTKRKLQIKKNKKLFEAIKEDIAGDDIKRRGWAVSMGTIPETIQQNIE